MFTAFVGPLVKAPVRRGGPPTSSRVCRRTVVRAGFWNEELDESNMRQWVPLKEKPKGLTSLPGPLNTEISPEAVAEQKRQRTAELARQAPKEAASDAKAAVPAPTAPTALAEPVVSVPYAPSLFAVRTILLYAFVAACVGVALIAAPEALTSTLAVVDPDPRVVGAISVSAIVEAVMHLGGAMSGSRGFFQFSYLYRFVVAFVVAGLVAAKVVSRRLLVVSVVGLMLASLTAFACRQDAEAQA